ncbi:MAG: bifunctional phosphoribosylaminoimidazolecarboxamide formyltransferase/IMP cyclohydrolase, partial [Clostridiales bacterium]|nr:bifunctional phosphoribosylaminoimidazolecarboxamide formyltransferase/IMP cyclohydrolase [Clostridiales bacterium]
PAMLRGAAKNYRDVTVVTDPRDYDVIIKEIENKGNTDIETRYDLALKVFEHTAHYDSLIANYLKTKTRKPDMFSETLTLAYEKIQDLRYGENPHQKAAFYKEIGNNKGTLVNGEQLQGKELSFNNINDANGALELLKEFSEPTIVAVKHTNPCGVASGSDIYDAWKKAYESDKVSVFGGIVAANRMITEQTAKEMAKIFLEVIIAPGFTKEALGIFSGKKNLRLIEVEGADFNDGRGLHIRRIQGGILVQDENNSLLEEIRVVTNTAPGEDEIEDLLFALRVVKHVKSNAIVIARNKQTLAIGPGQTSRIWALQNAIRNSVHPLKGSVLASDAFFPFRDCVDEAAKAGVSSIIQPGGSVNDAESIEACNEHGISMMFTGMRHFKH